MKITLRLKDPDGISESLGQCVENSFSDLDGKISQEEKDALLELRFDRVAEAIRGWVQYGEYVTIEIDTEENTAKVIPTR